MIEHTQPFKISTRGNKGIYKKEGTNTWHYTYSNPISSFSQKDPLCVCIFAYRREGEGERERWRDRELEREIDRQRNWERDDRERRLGFNSYKTKSFKWLSPSRCIFIPFFLRGQQWQCTAFGIKAIFKCTLWWLVSSTTTLFRGISCPPSVKSRILAT